MFLEHTSDAISITDDTGIIQYVNPAFEQVSGYNKEEIIGASIDVLRSENIFRKIYWENRGLLKEGEVFRKVFINKKKNGNFFYQDTRVLSVSMPEGNDTDIHYIAIGTDITETINKIQQVRLIEYELQKTNHTLETLLYKASHDLRSPIATIKGLIYLAKKDIHGPDTLTYLDMISSSTVKLDSLLTDIRKISTIHSNQFQVEEINFHHLINNILLDLEKFIPIKKIAIKIDVRINRKHYYSDYLLQRVLRNLIDNACRYRLMYSEKNKKHSVFITIREVGRSLEIDIADNGKGIKKDLQPRLFEMFYRADTASNRNGLGLFIAKTAVEKLNGRIELSSKYRKGTHVKVCLPREEMQPASNDRNFML